MYANRDMKAEWKKMLCVLSLRNEEVINVGRQEMTSVNGKSYTGNLKYV